MVYQRKKRAHEQQEQLPINTPQNNLFASPDLETDETDNSFSVDSSQPAPTLEMRWQQASKPFYTFDNLGSGPVYPPSSTVQRRPESPLMQAKQAGPMDNYWRRSAARLDDSGLRFQTGKPAVQRDVMADEAAVQKAPEGGADSAKGIEPLVQAKLTVGPAGDRYEQEADRVASHVVDTINSPGANSPVQRQTGADKEAGPEIAGQQTKGLKSIQPVTRAEDVQMKPTLQRVGPEGGAVSKGVEADIQSAKGRGQSLDTDLQQKMGHAMGADFSGVKVHTDSQSNQLNTTLQAKAFTTGQDVFFKRGEFQPRSREGQELIAHELTHVVQQTNNQIQRAIDPEDKSFIDRRVKTDYGGKGTILAIQGQGYTVAMETGDKIYVPAENLNFIQENNANDEKEDNNDEPKEIGIGVEQGLEEEYEGDQDFGNAKDFDNPKGKLKRNKYSKINWSLRKRKKNALFPPDSPKPDDVKQTNLGDCYLQAALASLAQQRPNYIKSMFHEVDEKTVTVRLYDPETLEAKYIKLKRSIPGKRKPLIGPLNKEQIEADRPTYLDDLFNRGALWVKLIQKAYAAANFIGAAHLKKEKANLEPSYGKIGSGDSEYALAALLGKQGTGFEVDKKVTEFYEKNAVQTDTDVKNAKNKKPSKGKRLSPFHLDMVKATATRKSWATNYLKKIFESVESINNNNKKKKSSNNKKANKGASSSLLDQWIKACKNKRNALLIRNVDKLFQGNRIHSLNNFVAKLKRIKGINASLISAFKQWVIGEGLVHVHGTGNLSKLEAKIFEDIGKALAKRTPIAAMARSSPSSGLKDAGYKVEEQEGTGEKKVGGMVFHHAHSIIGISKTQESGNPTQGHDPDGTVCWVKLRNPWGRNAAPDVKLGKIPGFVSTPEWDQKTGEYYLEMSYLLEYFRSVKFGAEPKTMKQK